MINDPIADMLTRIRNAVQREHKFVVIPYSNTKEEIAKILKNNGFINNYKVVSPSGKIHKNLIVSLKYKENKSMIVGLKRVSKPGLRIYSSYRDFPSVLNGYGIAIVSTSQGMMTNSEAINKKIGGEVLALIW